MRHAPVRRLAAASATCLALAALSAQQREAVVGTALLAGRVVDRVSEVPLANARVTLFAAGQPLREVLTGRDGRFVFPKLPSSTYEVRAFAPGFLHTWFGQKKPERAGSQIALADGGRREDLTIGLFRGGAIAGRIVGEQAQPLVGVTVHAFLLRHHERGPYLREAASTTSDDLGAYRLFGLGPGEYYIRATPTAGHLMHLRTPAWDVQPTATEGYIRTFYPAADGPSAAILVTVDTGADVRGIDLRLSLEPFVSVRGRLIGPPGFLVDRFTRVSDDPLVPPEVLSGTTVLPDGGFTVTSVPPGPFVLSVRAYSGPLTAGGKRLWGSVRVSVSAEDITGLQIALRPGATVSGVMRPDRDSPSAVPREGFSASALFLTPGVFAPGEVVGSESEPGGRFAISGLSAGRYQLFAAGGLGLWQLSGVSVNGRELTSPVIDVVDDLDGIELTLSDRRASLSGTIEVPLGSVPTDYTVILFAADADRRSSVPRIVYHSPVDTSGRYRMDGVLPGRYLLAVTDDIEQQAWYDPRVLEQLAPGATPVSIAAREAKVQHLRIGK